MYREDEPSALFHGLHRAHHRQVSEEQAVRGVGGLGSPMLLLVLLENERLGSACSQRELAGRMRLAPATVAVSLKSLERQGYVERSADDRDARRNLVRLTEKGREAVEVCGQVFRSVDERMLSGFDSGERELLTSFFRRMMKNLGGAPERPPFPPPPGYGAPPQTSDPQKEET